MTAMNSKKVNDKQKKRKKREELAKDRTWKVVGAPDIVYKPNLKVEEEERKKEDVECL